VSAPSGPGVPQGCHATGARWARASPDPTRAAQVMERLRDLGVLIGKGGLAGNVFRIKPPMCLTRADADFLVDALDTALGEL